jgi:hypothetical protein
MFFTWFEKHSDDSWWTYENSTFNTPEEAEKDFMKVFENDPSREYRIFPHKYPIAYKIIWTRNFDLFYQNGSLCGFFLND